MLTHIIIRVKNQRKKEEELIFII